MKLKSILPPAIVALVVVFDRIVKLWAVNCLKPLGTMPGIPGIFTFRYTENTGAAFSLFQNRRIFLLLAGFLAVIWLVSLLAGIKPLWGKTAIYFTIGGAIGNMLDRLFYGFVIDMIDISFMNFAIFNIADCFVSIGTVMLIIYMLFFAKDTEKSKVSEKSDESANAGGTAFSDEDNAND